MTEEKNGPKNVAPPDRQAVIKRLKRVEGQVRGIARMVEEERYCIDVLTQIAAVRAAIDKVALAVVSDHARHCVIHADKSDQDARVDELVAALSRYVGTR